jgi:hypothetical protein
MSTPSDSPTARIADRDTEAGTAIAIKRTGSQRLIYRERQQHGSDNPKLDRVGGGAGHAVQRSSGADLGIGDVCLVDRETRQFSQIGGDVKFCPELQAGDDTAERTSPRQRSQHPPDVLEGIKAFRGDQDDARDRGQLYEPPIRGGQLGRG